MIYDENAQKVVELLIKKNLKLATAESCTGGLLGAAITSISGVSNIYKEGFITYSNEAKEKYLSVNHNTLEKYGAVSEETAYEMAKGVCQNTNSDIGVGITGIAGPNGGTKEKPVGLVYISCYYNSNIIISKNIFSGDRKAIRESAVKEALNLILQTIK